MRINLPTKSDQVEQWGPIDMKLLYNSFWFAPMSGAVKSPWGIYWAEMVGIMENDTGTFYWWKNSLEREGVKSIKKLLLNDSKRKSVTKDYWKVVAGIQNTFTKFEELGTKAKFEDVKTLALDWQSLYYKFWGITDVFEIANYGAPGYLKDQLSGLVLEENLNSVMEILLAPEELSFNQQSEKELLECFLKTASKKDLDLLLIKHAAKWHWLENSYYQSKRLSPAYFFNKLGKLSKNEAKIKLAQINKYPQSTKNRKAEIIKKFKLPKNIAKLASVLSFSIWMQDHRKGIAWRSSDIATQFSKHLAKKIGVSLNDILHYSADEWRHSFITGKKLSDKIFNSRKNKLYTMYSRKGFYTFLTGKAAERIAKHFKDLKKTDERKKLSLLSGTVVSKGSKIIRGTVRILTSARDSSKMKPEEILVTAMTSPDFINAMRLAKAIVTDVGGLMSHAAVISRELGIPCIVGTKYATKIFKDGDIIEVDANKGLVKKLN